MDNQASEDELEKQIESITQAMFVTLSEWQAGVPIDWHSAKVKGRADLLALLRNEKLKLLAEVRERVVGEDTQNPYSKSSDRFFNDWGHQASEYDKFIRGGMRDKLTKLEAEL